MGVSVAFNYDQWVQLFPQFAYLDEPTVTAFWDVVGQSFHRNDGGGPVNNAGLQTTLMNWATAHLVQLFAPNNTTGQPNRDPNVVGRITNAAEGSVSVATEMASGSNQNAAWWRQTQFGAAYWQATAPFRTMRYLPGAPKPVNPWPIFGMGPGGWWGNW